MFQLLVCAFFKYIFVRLFFFSFLLYFVVVVVCFGYFFSSIRLLWTKVLHRIFHKHEVKYREITFSTLNGWMKCLLLCINCSACCMNRGCIIMSILQTSIDHSRFLSVSFVAVTSSIGSNEKEQVVLRTTCDCYIIIPVYATDSCSS